MQFYLTKGSIVHADLALTEVARFTGLNNFYIMRGSKVIDITSYPSFLLMSMTFDLRNIKKVAPSGMRI